MLNIKPSQDSSDHPFAHSSPVNSRPLVSIIIPTFNALRFLPQTIASVMHQTLQDFEVLLIDDGSSDGTADWVEQFNSNLTQSHSPVRPIRFFQQQHGGVSVARNLGIQHAQGDYIAFLDADDLWLPTKLEQQVVYLNQHPDVGLVHGAIAMMDEAGNLTGRILSSQPDASTLPRLLTQNAIACQTVMVRRSCLDRAGYFDSQANSMEDWDLWLRVAQFDTIAVLPKVLAHYRQVESSLSRNHERMVAIYHYVIDKNYQFCQDELMRLGFSVRSLKAKSYGMAYQCLAWKAIQCAAPDLKQAWRYQREALKSQPSLVFTGEYWRLIAALGLKQLLPAGRYRALKASLYQLRSSLKATSTT